MTIKLSKSVFSLGLALVLATASASQAQESADSQGALQEIEIELPWYLWGQYQDYVADYDPLTAETVKAEGLWRHLAEVVVFQIAPVIGGCECRVIYREGTVDSTFLRELAEIRNGRALSFPVATYDELVDTSSGQAALSSPVLRADEFYVGFYTNANREDVLSLRDPEDIMALRYSVVRSWNVDLSVLQSRAFKTVLADDWYTIMRMIKNSRSDVVLQPFSRAADFSTVDEVSGETLAPIPGFKMAFPHARRYAVSLQHPDGEAFLEALNAGLAAMRDTGLLEEYMTKAGVIDPRIATFDEI